MTRRRRKRRISRIRMIIGLLLFLAAAAAVVLGVFRIRAVEISGSNRHSAEEIKEDLIYDFWTENTLFFAWKYKTAVSDTRTPYLDSIQAKLISPGKVRIAVKEKTLAGYIQYAGTNVYFDQEGMVLEMTDQVYEDLPLVSGVAMQEPALYQKLPVENTAQLRTMLSISQLLLEAGLVPDSISFDENLNITLMMGSVEVKMGQDEYLEEKVSNLATIYQQVKGETGTLKLEAYTGKNETITFQKGDETEATAETDENGDPVAAETDENGDPVAAETDENGDPVAAETNADGNGDPAAAETDENGNPTDGQTGENADSGEDGTVSGETTGLSAFMVFDSSGTLRYDAHVVNGQVVDANGTPIDGCYVNEDGNVVDAYMNVIDPQTGTLAQ